MGTGDEEIKKMVRKQYGKIAHGNISCCGTAEPCCGSGSLAGELSKSLGYSDKEVGGVPEGSNLGLGCGNPLAFASLTEGECVLDLGSGAGFDCFLAAQRVGVSGRVIGVDMTPEMIEKARENAEKDKYENVEFRLGEIEDLPIDDNSVDVVISNCVINLSPDKAGVFREAFRTLRPDGRIMISDIVLLKGLPDFIKDNVAAYVGCVSGAILKDEYVEGMRAAGFQDIKVIEETPFPIEFILNDPTARAIIEKMKITNKKIEELASSIISIKVCGIK